NRLAVSTMSVDGKTCLAFGVAPKLSIQRPVVGIDLSAVLCEVIAPVKIKMAEGVAAIFLAGSDPDLTTLAGRRSSQTLELRCCHRIHPASVRACRFVVGQY